MRNYPNFLNLFTTFVYVRPSIIHAAFILKKRQNNSWNCVDSLQFCLHSTDATIWKSNNAVSIRNPERKIRSHGNP